MRLTVALFLLGLAGCGSAPTNVGKYADFTVQQSGTTEDLIGIWGSSATDVYVVGTNGTILHTEDSGTTWVSQTSGTTSTLFAVWGSSSRDVYAVGTNGVVLHTLDGGKTWASGAINLGNPASLRVIGGSSSRNVFTGGDGGSGVVYHSTSGGAVWMPQNLMDGRNLTGLWGNPGGQVFVALSFSFVEALILGTADGGGTWTTAHTGVTGYLNALWSNGQDVYAAGEQGRIVRSNDSGATFTELITGSTDYVSGIWGNGGQLYTVGGHGAMRVTLNSGNDWATLPVVTPKDLSTVWGSGPQDVYAVGQFGTILHGQ